MGKLPVKWLINLALWQLFGRMCFYAAGEARNKNARVSGRWSSAD
jgi:hypothetical protein